MYAARLHRSLLWRADSLDLGLDLKPFRAAADVSSMGPATGWYNNDFGFQKLTYGGLENPISSDRHIYWESTTAPSIKAHLNDVKRSTSLSLPTSPVSELSQETPSDHDSDSSLEDQDQQNNYCCSDDSCCCCECRRAGYYLNHGIREDECVCPWSQRQPILVDEPIVEPELVHIYKKMKREAAQGGRCLVSSGNKASSRLKESNRSTSVLSPRSEPPLVRSLARVKPFNRHQMYQRFWKLQPAIGEDFRFSLRQEVRQRMLKQDKVNLPHRIFIPNPYVVPTCKPRFGLRWFVRKCNHDYRMPPCGNFNPV